MSYIDIFLSHIRISSLQIIFVLNFLIMIPHHIVLYILVYRNYKSCFIPYFLQIMLPLTLYITLNVHSNITYDSSNIFYKSKVIFLNMQVQNVHILLLSHFFREVFSLQVRFAQDTAHIHPLSFPHLHL